MPFSDEYDNKRTSFNSSNNGLLQTLDRCLISLGVWNKIQVYFKTDGNQNIPVCIVKNEAYLCINFIVQNYGKIMKHSTVLHKKIIVEKVFQYFRTRLSTSIVEIRNDTLVYKNKILEIMRNKTLNDQYMNMFSLRVRYDMIINILWGF